MLAVGRSASQLFCQPEDTRSALACEPVPRKCHWPVTHPDSHALLRAVRCFSQLTSERLQAQIKAGIEVVRLGGRYWMARKKKQRASAPAPAAATNRKEFDAEKLVGTRAVKGKKGNGEPNYVYEVQWKGAHKNTWEPAECLVGWEEEMRTID